MFGYLLASFVCCLIPYIVIAFLLLLVFVVCPDLQIETGYGTIVTLILLGIVLPLCLFVKALSIKRASRCSINKKGYVLIAFSALLWLISIFLFSMALIEELSRW